MSRRAPSARAPSPTPTAFSGISNYRTDSYRPKSNQNAPPLPSDPRAIARTHFIELSQYLAEYLARTQPGQRTTARAKLTRLTIQQFQELSTDVYDELVRRKKNTGEADEVPFLPVREDFHPKRNQARQKLATLPSGRFEDLSSDVYYELARRYPEFTEDASDEMLDSPRSAYDDDTGSPGGFQATSPPPRRPSIVTSVKSPPRASSSSGRRPSEDMRSKGRPSVDEGRYGASPPTRKLAVDDDMQSPYTPATPYSGTSDTFTIQDRDRRRPSQDTSNDYGRRPSGSSTSGDAQSATATSGMIIPNKSTIAEEEIEVPYGRDARDSGSTAMNGSRERSARQSRDRDFSDERDTDGDSPADYASPRGGFSGLSGLSARLRDEDDDENDRGTAPYGRASVASDRSRGSNGRASAAGNRGNGTTNNNGGRTSIARGSEDGDRIRREYELKLATMQSRITGLERDLGDMEENERKWENGEQRVRQMEEDLEGLRRKADEQGASMRLLQKEIDELRETQKRDAARAREDDEEIQTLRERCDLLEQSGGGGADPEVVEQLRTDMEGLFTELSDLSRENDELQDAKDADANTIRELDNRMQEYKRKYEQAKTELRSMKATSQLFLQAPKSSEDQLPMSADGGVLDIHITSFLSGIDNLLTAGRSNAPSKVLGPMKTVVNAVSAIIDDIRAFERRSEQDRAEVDPDALRDLADRAEATLSNLVAASRTHATSSGMSPVSLLDAAASHVGATVTEVGRTLCIRKATKAEQEAFGPIHLSVKFAPDLKDVDETRPSSKKPNPSSPVARSPMSPARNEPGRTMEATSPRQQAPQRTNETRFVDETSTEDAWIELKPYLEAQTDAILYSIQNVLSGVRSGSNPASLNENMTQIITVVSSIVAVCDGNIPAAHRAQGDNLLRDLGEHTNKLSELQSLPEIGKEDRQLVAKSSFAIANAMKMLVKLG